MCELYIYGAIEWYSFTPTVKTVKNTAGKIDSGSFCVLLDGRKSARRGVGPVMVWWYRADKYYDCVRDRTTEKKVYSCV